MILDKLVQRLDYKNYKDYLNSPHWKSVKLKLLKSKLVKRDSNGMPICEACDSDKKLHVHHRTYKNLGKEKVMDLALVCELCHSFIHHFHKQKNLNLWSATKKAIKLIRKTKSVTFTVAHEINLKKLDREVSMIKINFGH